MDNCKQNQINFSSYLQQREDLLKNHEVPLQSEMMAQLGEPLTNVVTSTMTDVGKHLMGKFDSLIGPPRDMWISPSDHLIGKVRLTPPFSNKVLKALSHQTIIELGIQTEEKLKNEMDAIIDKVKEETSNFEKFKCCKHLRHAVEKERKEQEYIRKIFKEELIKKYELKLAKIKQCYEESIALRVKYVIKKCDIETQKFIEEDRKMVEAYVRSELSKCYEEKVEKMKIDFTNGILHVIEHQKAIDYTQLKEMHHEYKLELKTDRNQMKCQHIVDLMHFLCAEKAKYNKKIVETKAACNEKVEDITNFLNSILNEKPEIKECPNIKMWHNKCLQILQNYEKFVGRTVSDIPGQGSYLINVQKMLETQINELQHTHNNYQCYQNIGVPPQLNLTVEKPPRVLDDNGEIKLISKPNTDGELLKTCRIRKNTNDEEPFKIYFDHLKKEETPEPTDSFASIEFNGKKYVNLNKFLENPVEIVSCPDIKIKWVEPDTDTETTVSSGDSLFMTEYVEELDSKKIDLEHFTKKIIGKIRTDIISSSINAQIKSSSTLYTEDLTKKIESVLNNHIRSMINVKEIKALIDADPTVFKNKRKSKLLAVTDSLEIYKEKLADATVESVVVPIEPNLILEAEDSVELLRSKSIIEHSKIDTRCDDDSETNIKKMTMDQYLQSFEKAPPYLFTNFTADTEKCLKDDFYKTASDLDILELMKRFKDRQSIVKSVTSILSVDTARVHLDVENSKDCKKVSVISKTRNSYENRELTVKKSKTDRLEILNNQMKLKSLIEILEDDAEVTNLLRRY